jgi:hypothetical protein
MQELKVVYLSRSIADSYRMDLVHNLLAQHYSIKAKAIYVPDNREQVIVSDHLDWLRLDKLIFGVHSNLLFSLVFRLHHTIGQIYPFRSADVLFVDYSSLKGSPLYFRLFDKLKRKSKITYALPHGSGNVFHAMHLKITIPRMNGAWNMRVHPSESNGEPYELITGDPFFLLPKTQGSSSIEFDIVLVESGSIEHYVKRNHVEEFYSTVKILGESKNFNVAYAGHPRNIRIDSNFQTFYGETSNLIQNARLVICDCFTSILAEIHFFKVPSLIFCPDYVSESYREFLGGQGFTTFSNETEMLKLLQDINEVTASYGPSFKEFYAFKENVFLDHIKRELARY